MAAIIEASVARSGEEAVVRGEAEAEAVVEAEEEEEATAGLKIVHLLRAGEVTVVVDNQGNQGKVVHAKHSAMVFGRMESMSLVDATCV